MAGRGSGLAPHETRSLASFQTEIKLLRLSGAALTWFIAASRNERMVAVKNSSRIMGLGACVMVAGCGGRAAMPPAMQVAPSKVLRGVATDWREVATPADRSRLRGWRQSWIDALVQVPGGREASPIAADPALFDPDRALPGAAPPPGTYSCRVFKLGANGTAMRAVTTYPAIGCAVTAEAGVPSIRATTGAQRPIGLIFPDGPSRAVFLGTMILGDETSPLVYGQDASRDMAGYIERIGPKRWRLVLPRPRFESILDVVEIVPASKR